MISIIVAFIIVLLEKLFVNYTMPLRKFKFENASSVKWNVILEKKPCLSVKLVVYMTFRH